MGPWAPGGLAPRWGPRRGGGAPAGHSPRILAGERSVCRDEWVPAVPERVCPGGLAPQRTPSPPCVGKALNSRSRRFGTAPGRSLLRRPERRTSTPRRGGPASPSRVLCLPGGGCGFVPVAGAAGVVAGWAMRTCPPGSGSARASLRTRADTWSPGEDPGAGGGFVCVCVDSLTGGNPHTPQCLCLKCTEYCKLAEYSERWPRHNFKALLCLKKKPHAHQQSPLIIPKRPPAPGRHGCAYSGHRACGLL